MTPHSLPWTPDPYLTDVERRPDGTLYLQPRKEIEPYPERLLDRLVHWAEVAPDRTLVARRDASGEWCRVSYAEMLLRVQRVAAGLLKRELSAEKPVVILSGNSIEHLTLAFACMWAGIPHCSVSPSYSLISADFQKLKYVMELLTPGIVAAFDTPQFARAIDAVVPQNIDIIGDAELAGRTVIDLSQLECETVVSVEEMQRRSNRQSIAKFLLTSGSTGQPKAVIIKQEMMCSNVSMIRQAMPFLKDEPPVLVDWLPWNHTFGGSHNISLVVVNGGSLYIDDGKPTPTGFAVTVRNLEEIAPTVFFNVPKGFEALTHHLRINEKLRHRFYSRLRAYFFAAASLSQHIWDRLDAFSMQERGFKIPMLSGLGATETGPSVTFTTPAVARAGVIGLPAAGNTVKLAPLGDKLEIRAKGPNITPGYWRNPELTRAVFDEEGFYRMGDAVRLIDGADPTRGLKFDGRIAEDFKLASGTWVSVGPLRVELLSACAPLLQDVVIAGLDCDYLAALLIPDVSACNQVLSAAFAYDELVQQPALHALIQERLRAHAERFPATSRCIKRAMLLPTPPVLDAGEITDKGSINQRAVLQHRAECVTELFFSSPSSSVIVVEE